MSRVEDNSLGQKVRQFREKTGYSQEQVAKRLGLNRVSYTQLENGSRKVSADELVELSSLFGMTPDGLLGLKKEVKVTLQKAPKQKKAEQEIRISVPAKNIKKFRQVLLHILEKIGSQPNVGESVLCKLFYFIDFDYYEKFEEQLTGSTYICNHYGPTPAAFVEIIKQMEDEGEIKKETLDYHSYKQKKYFPLKRADLSLLNGRELQHIDEVIARLGRMSATEIMDYSHGDVPWMTTAENQPIDYEKAFYRQPPYSARTYEDSND